jgi:hypothetical protein
MIVGLVVLVVIGVVATWAYLNRSIYVIVTPTDEPVESYSVAEPTVLYANLLTGPGETFVAAYAAETTTTVTLHVEVLPATGTTMAVGLMAAEPITLNAPLGDRTVLNTLGQQLREVPVNPLVGTIDEVIAQWEDSLTTPTGTLAGVVRSPGGSADPDLSLEVSVRSETDGSVRTFDTDRQGRYAMPLAPGRYTLLCSPEQVFLVEEGEIAEVDCVQGKS